MPYTPQNWEDSNVSYPLSASRMLTLETQMQTVTSASEATAQRATYAAVVPSGSSYVARKLSDGTQISTGSNAATVIQAAVDSAVAAGGGLVQLAAVTYPISTGITLGVRTGLIGQHTYNRHTNTCTGTVLQSNGLGATAAVVSAGVSGSATEGVLLQNIAVDGNSQSYAVHTVNCTDLRLINCTFLRGTQRCVYIESTISPDNGGVAANIHGCMIRTTASGGTGLYIDGTGATDGILTASRILNNTVGVRLWGGWIVSGCHITGNTSTTANIEIGSGATQCEIVGNYLDTAGSGSNLVLNGHSHVVTGNQIFNHDATTVVGIALNGVRNTVTGNTFRMQAATTAYGMQKADNTLPTGVYGPNFMSTDGSAGICFAYSNGTAVPSTDTANTWVQGNKRD